MIGIEICYDHKSFNCARTAIVHVTEQEGVTYINEYFEMAKTKLLTYAFRKFGISENEIVIHNWKYHGDAVDIVTCGPF